LTELEKLRSKDPKKIGPYKLVGRIGSGGMGVVFLGTLGAKQVAVKTVRSGFLDDPGLKSRFSREIDNLKKMNSPRIAKYLDSSINGEIAWHAVEYIDGPNLRDLVKTEGPLLEDQWWSLASQLVDALQYLDKLGIVHRDIKPSNIIMSENGISLVDFGISQDTDSTSITTTGMLSGSPAWLAPEQLEGSAIGSASDWFSAGSVLVFAARGKSPWGNETSMTIPVLHQKILTGSPDLAGLTKEQKDLLENLLHSNPKSRKLPKSLPKPQVGTPKSASSKTSLKAGKRSSTKPTFKKSTEGKISSPAFNFALVLTFLVGGVLGVSQVVPIWPWQTAAQSEESTQLYEGLSTSDFSPGLACGELEIASEKLINSMEISTSKVRSSSWGALKPEAESAVEEYRASILEIAPWALPQKFIDQNLLYLQGLQQGFEAMDPNSTSTLATSGPEYLSWRTHVGDIFKPGNWCG
jgi:serine/threonine protein kinase